LEEEEGKVTASQWREKGEKREKCELPIHPDRIHFSATKQCDSMNSTVPVTYDSIQQSNKTDVF